MRAVGDTSTIDFMYIPEFDPDMGSAPVLRVPILPFTEASESVKAHATEAEEVPVRQSRPPETHWNQSAVTNATYNDRS